MNLSLRARLATMASVALLAVAACAGSASSAPLNETEPNESVVAANGPFPADGFVQTVSTTNDKDFAYGFLQAQQQVTFSLTKLAGSCNSTHITATDWIGRKWLDDKYLGDDNSFAWTTPPVPVRVDVGDFFGNVGCQMLFKVSPGTVVFAGPLPALPPRSIAVADGTVFVAGGKNKVTLVGSAWEDDKATARLQSTSSGQCSGSAPNDASDYAERWTPSLTTAPFNAAVTVETSTPGTYYLCSWLANPSSDIGDLLGSKRVNVIRRGTARLESTTVKRGKRFKARIRYVGGFVEFNFSRNGALVKKINGRVRKGWASVPTSKLPAATYKLSIYGNGVRILNKRVWIRR